jgi:hypothetical protein
LTTFCPSDTAWDCAPIRPDTVSPSLNFGLREASTVPAAKARIVSPMPTGGT